MLTAHHANAFLAIAVCVISAAWGFVAYRRGRDAGRTLTVALRAERAAPPPAVVRRRHAARRRARGSCHHDGMKFWGRMNPTVRGFLIIALIALVIVAFQLYNTLTALFLIARIAFP